jgi:hypothetical protein
MKTERLRMLSCSKRKLRAVGERGHVFALQSFGSLLGMVRGEALCGSGTNRPEAERSSGSAVTLEKGD